jgi:flagellar L-ring protein precursor FlgH
MDILRGASQIVLGLCLAGSVSGCAGDIREIGREPKMSAVGTGLATEVQASPSALFTPQTHPRQQSMWDGGRADIFSDPRATKIGDVVTVNIAINDSASFGNQTDRSLNSEVKTGYNMQLQTSNSTSQLNPSIDATSLSTAQGQGTIARSEQIQLSVAAVVTDVLPNGNLIVSGSQEVRVNYEMRILNIAGIIRPRDISKDNAIPYNKIAEARISYGGRGREMEVQQPAVGQQIWDRFKPL